MRKEWKQILQNKKMLIILLGTILYAPLLNNLINYEMGPLMAPIIPLELGQMLILLIGALYSVEFIYSIMNAEFISQSYEVLEVSKINKIIIVLSKITLPICFSSFILFTSFLLNEILIVFTNKSSFTKVMNVKFFGFSMGIFIFLALFILYQLVKQQSVMDKQRSTFFIAVGFIFIFLFINLYYLNFVWIAYLAVFIVNIYLFLRITYLLSDYKVVISNQESKTYFENKSVFFLILCSEGYSYVWNHIKTFIYLAIIIISSIILNHYKQPFLSSLFLVMIYLFLGNFIISQSLIVEKRMHGLLIMKIAKVPLWKIVSSRVIMPIILGVIGTIIIQFSSKTNLLTLSQTLNFLALNLFMNLSILVSYLFIENIKYVAQYCLLITVFIFILGICLIIFNVPWYVILLIDVLLFLMSVHQLKNNI